MVRILDTGEIVPDNDERAQQQDSRNTAVNALRRRDAAYASSAGPPSTGQDGYQGPRGPYHGETSPHSLFDAANNRLLQAGIPRFNITQSLVIEPLVAVAILIAVLFFGLPGLLLVGFIYVVRELSRGEGPVHRTLSRWMAGDSTQQPPGPSSSQSTTGGQTSRKTAGPSSTKSDKKATFGGSGKKLGHS